MLVSQVKAIKKVDMELLLQLLHKINRLINGAAAGTGLAFVYYQYQKTVITYFGFSFKVAVMGGPLRGKTIKILLHLVGFFIRQLPV